MGTWKSKNRHKYLLQYHMIFVCKYRKKLLVSKQIADDIKQFSYEICQKHHVIIRYMEADKDHIHYMIETEPTVSVSRIVNLMKVTLHIIFGKGIKIICKTFGCCRFVYNQTLAYRKETYEKEKKSVSKTDCNNFCNRELKKEYGWLKEVDKFALTNAIYNMDSAYRKFLRNMQDIRNSRANMRAINPIQRTSQMEILRWILRKER